MSEQLVLAAERRDRAGKGAARATRRAGSVPAVIYGDNKAAELISIDPIELRIALKKRSFFSALLSLKLDVNVTQPDGASALHWAAERDLVDGFVSAAADQRAEKRSAQFRILKHELLVADEERRLHPFEIEHLPRDLLAAAARRL